MSNIMLSSEECPYGCNNGYLFDINIKKKVPCPHCSTKRKELVDKGQVFLEDGEIGELSRVVGVSNKYLKANFVYDTVIPDNEKVYLEEESLDYQRKVLDEVYLGITVGQLPERSWCFGLGIKGRIDRLVYPLLAKAYLSGLTISKFISCCEYSRMLMNMEEDVRDLYKKDLVVMLIPDGASKGDISSAKGLMQCRAGYGKPTIFITTWIAEACSMLLGYPDDDDYYLAGACFVSYKKSKGSKSSKYVQNLTGVTNDMMGYQEDTQDIPNEPSNLISLADL